MQDQTNQISHHRDRRLERAVVSQTLREDRTGGWRRADLAAELGEDDPIAIRNALTRLEEEGVIACEGEHVRASRAAVRLNDLEMLAV